jgi:HSP20 family protein
MSLHSPAKRNEFLPSFIDDFFKPWNGWFDNRLEKMFSVPSVNITESNDGYKITVAAPGLQKTDFNIAVNGNTLTVSAESERNEEQKEGEKVTRQEYNYSSFSRSFTLPGDVNKDKVSANYDGGVLTLALPKNEKAQAPAGKTIAVN